ncbi:MAG: ABC transporter permease, partial [Acidobacteriota bacterium]
MQSFLQDVRYSLRLLVKNPGFALIAVIALALGIGANTAIFSVVNEVLLRQLPYREPDQLVMVWEHNRPRSREMNVISPANFLDWQDQNSVFEQMAVFADRRFNLTGIDDPEEVPAQMVSVNLFPMLGAGPALGRVFSTEDSTPDGPAVVILSNALWQRRFGANPAIVGQTIALSGNKYTVVGVMAPEFQFFIKEASFGRRAAEMWVPVRFAPSDRIRRGRYMSAVARLKPGVTLSQAQVEMNAIASRIETQYPDFNTGWGVNLVPLAKQITGEIRPALLVLFGAVGFVLLIACANVANLILARSSVRAREVAIRAALGANRLRLIRQLLTESVMLASVGGAMGLLVAYWGVDLLIALAPQGLLQISSVTLDYRVLGFTFGTTLLTGLIFGIVPAIAASHLDLNNGLKEGGRGANESAGGRRLRATLVVAEIALALILLVGAGLLIRSAARLQAVDPGFNSKNLLTIRLQLPGSKYGEEHQIVAFYRDLLRRVEALPGVQSVSANAFPPFTGPGSATSFFVEGRPKPPAGQDPVADVRVVDPKYFQTMSIPLLSGRTFSDAEATEARHVVIINEALAKQYFPGQNALGQRLTINMKVKDVPSEIIGVVGDVKHASLDSNARAMTYWPHPELAFSSMTLLIRTESDPLQLTGAVQREVKTIDKDQPISEVRTMEQLLATSTARSRFVAVLLAIFAGV